MVACRHVVALLAWALLMPLAASQGAGVAIADLQVGCRTGCTSEVGSGGT